VFALKRLHFYQIINVLVVDILIFGTKTQINVKAVPLHTFTTKIHLNVFALQIYLLILESNAFCAKRPYIGTSILSYASHAKKVLCMIEIINLVFHALNKDH
jgi:hypothetical protein